MLSAEDNELLTRTGPGTPMGTLLRRFWLPLMLSREIPEPDCDPVRVRILSEDLVAFRDSHGRPGLVEDMAVQEGMGPIVDRTQERLGVTDLGIIGMRQMLLRAARDLSQGIEPFWAGNADAYDVGGVMFLREQDVPFETVLEEAKARMRVEVPTA